MTLSKQDLAFIFGFSVTGDFGYTTWYTRADGMKVFFPKYLLDGKIRTPARVAARDRWRAAAVEWKLLTIDEKANWNTATKKLSLPVTGYNLFLWWQTMQDETAIRTIEQQSGLTLI